MNVSLRPYQTNDFDAVYALWQTVFESSWPLTPRFLARMLTGHTRYQPGDHMLAEQDGRVVGFVATHPHADGKTAGIQFMLVLPEHQRQGIGGQLHDAALAHFHQKGNETVHLARGGVDYFWPGVPSNCPGALDFFKSCGWSFPESCFDLTRDLADYQTPPGVMERIAPHNIDIRPCAAEEVSAILDFEWRMFPYWAIYYQHTTEEGRHDDILVAWDDKTPVGAVLMNKADVAGMHPDALWHRILGDDLGTIGAVGVDDARRGQGIGLALVGAAAERLRARGVRQCLIGWTDLLSFYGRLGYTVWREYAMNED
jgi:predicted N-acetyltransferase YhbS